MVDSAMNSSSSPDSSEPRTTVRGAVFELLRGFGLRTVFGNPGSTELPMFVDFPADFRYVLGLQESVVVGMADGHAQATRNAAFVNLHSAVGVGHAMGAIFTAYKNRTPMLITAGQQSRSILPFDPFLASARATELPRPYVKWAVEPARAEDVPLAIARAYYLAMMPPRGPVLVSVPADDWAMPADALAPRRVASALRPDPALLAEIGAALDGARAPAFVVGAAVDRDGAWDQAVQLAERHHARVFIAPMAGTCGFPGDHALFAGSPEPDARAHRRRARAARCGGGRRCAGLHLSRGRRRPARAAAHAAVPADRRPRHRRLGAAGQRRAVQPEARLAGPAGPAGAAAHARPRHAGSGRPAPSRRRPASGCRWPTCCRPWPRPRDPSSIVVEEAPSARPVMHERLPILRSGTFYEMCSGGLGFGMAAAVGVALARPEARTIALIGDGSAMYTIQALWNAAQAKLPITFIILNNGRYAALQDFAPRFGFAAGVKPEGSDLPGLDFLALAAGHGVPARRIRSADELQQALPAALCSEGPLLLDIEVA